MKQLSKHGQYESAVHAEDTRLAQGLRTSSDAELEELLETNKRYHRLAVLQLAEDVSRGWHGNEESTRRAFEYIRAQQARNEGAAKHGRASCRERGSQKGK